MLRIIYSLYVDFGVDSFGCRTVAVIPLDRRGMAAPRRARDRKEGMPRLPNKRTIDLRPADEIRYLGAWWRIESIEAYRDAWINEAKNLRPAGDDGYLYRPVGDGPLPSSRRRVEMG